MTVLAADWQPPPGVRAFTTTRAGGLSSGAYGSLNLAVHVGDDPGRVRQNRMLVRQNQGWNEEPLWLDQVHGTQIVRAEDLGRGEIPQADGAVTSRPGRPLVILTADCLPVVACDREGSVVGAFHAGWRGLLAGVLEAGLRALGKPASDLLVWIGPAIGPDSYQVGPEVRDAYLAADQRHEGDFRPDGAGRWKLDLAGAAIRRLSDAGVPSVSRCHWDTFRDTDLFFSHRRQSSGTEGGSCGRMGTFIVLESRRHP